MALPSPYSARYMRAILEQIKLPATKIPQHVLDAVRGEISEGSPLKFMWQYRKSSIRKRYGTFGKNSGLKAGICWPTREELDFMKEHEKTFEKSFQQMASALKRNQSQAQAQIAKREKEIKENLKKLPEQKKEFFESYHQLFEDIEQEKVKKEKVIQEVREFLGYDIDASDPRFEEAIAKKDEEEKATLRAARKLEKQRQNMEMLQSLVAEALEREKEGKKNEPVKASPPEQS